MNYSDQNQKRHGPITRWLLLRFKERSISVRKPIVPLEPSQLSVQQGQEEKWRGGSACLQHNVVSPHEEGTLAQ